MPETDGGGRGLRTGTRAERGAAPLDRVETVWGGWVVLRAVATAEDPIFWPLADVRAARRTTRRTVLLGDAAGTALRPIVRPLADRPSLPVRQQ